MGKKGESGVVVVLLVMVGLFLSLNVLIVSADGNCLYGSDVVEVTSPLDTIVVDFGEPVSVDFSTNDIQFTFYPDSAEGANFETSEPKKLELVSSENDQIFKFKPVEDYVEKYRYSLFVRGYTKTDGADGSGVLLEQCKYIYVDYGPLEIIKTKPTEKYVADIVPELEFQVNRKSECRISGTTETFDSMIVTLTSQEGYIHSGSIPGFNTFWVACKDINDNIVSKSFTVISDTTPPSTPLVDDSSDIPNYPDRTNQVSLLRVKFSSTDEESGIDYINYTVAEKETGVYITDWKTTSKLDEWLAIGDLNLINGKEYMFVAVAKNNAGMMSEQGMSDGILVDSLFDPNNLGPTVFCSNGILDNGETYLDCGGLCPGCEVGHECTIDADCSSGFCNGDTLQCTIPTCSDGFKNGNEPDIDCGGNCNETCALGLQCVSNDDCSSGYCLSDVCSQANCFDSVKNGLESDVDCGGDCDLLCPANRHCNSNEDCESFECDSFLKTCVGHDSETKEKTNNSTGLILIIISSLIVLGGGGYYLYATGKIALPGAGGSTSAKTPLNASSSKTASVGKPTSSQSETNKQTQAKQVSTGTSQSLQSSPKGIDTAKLASKLRKDLTKKEQTRELHSLFGGFNDSISTNSVDNENSKTDDDSLVSKEDIDNLFGTVGSKSSLNKLDLSNKKKK